MEKNKDQSKENADQAAGKTKEVKGGLAGHQGHEVNEPNQKNTGYIQPKPGDVKPEVKSGIPKV